MKKVLQKTTIIITCIGSFFFPQILAAANPVIPNDPDFARQAYLEQSNVQDAWKLTTGSAQTVVAIIDSGVNIDHPDLQDNIWINPKEIPGDGSDNDGNGLRDDIYGWDFVNDIPDVKPKYGGSYYAPAIHHGTIVAGIIAASSNNGIGIAGISWRTKIMPLRVLDNRGNGEIANVVKAIDYAVSKKVDAINLSFVGDFDNPLLKSAVERASQAQIPVIAAAGNDRKDSGATGEHQVYPACYSGDIVGVIGVSSLDPLGQKAPFSDYGDCTTISAPGMDLYSSQAVNYEYPGFDAYYGSGWSGTSLSTAIISGTIALLKSVKKDMAVRDIKTALVGSCDPIDDLNKDYRGKLGCGRVNIARAVRATHNVVRDIRESNPFDADDLRSYPIGISTSDGREGLKLFDGTGHAKKMSTPFYPYAPFRIPFTFSQSRSGDLIAFGPMIGGPHVRIFDRNFRLVRQFFAYDKNFRGGVSVVFADTDGDDIEELITVPGPGSEPLLRIFDLKGNRLREFHAYNQSYRNGLDIRALDVNHDGKDEFLIIPRSAQRGELHLLDKDGVLLTTFFAYPQDPVMATNAVVGDIDGDGDIEIIVAPRSRGSGVVKIFTPLGDLKQSFLPFGKALPFGLSVAVGKSSSASTHQDIFVAPAERAGAHVFIMNAQGKKVGAFFTLPKDWRGGLVLGILQ